MTNMQKNSGMTLVELLLTVFILTVGIVSTLFFFSSTMLLTGLSRDITVAATHGEYVMEEIRARQDIADIINTDWAEFAAKEELLTLPAETITVDFGDTQKRPLDIHLTVGWVKQGRPNKVDIHTKIIRDEPKI